MYARRATHPKPLLSKFKKFDAPTAGWISNRALSDPRSIEGVGAAILDNFFPTSSKVVLRRGEQLYATLGAGEDDVSAIFSYRNGTNRRLFATTASAIYDITNIVFPESTEIVTEDADLIVTEDGDWFGTLSTDGHEVMTGLSGGKWATAQFATTGGVYLIGVNGEDEGFIFDGTDFFPYVEGGIDGLAFDGETTGFSSGEVVTGGTSGATGTIVKVVSDGTSGHLWLRDVAGTFENDEALTGSEGGVAVVDGAPMQLVPGLAFDNGLTSADMDYVWVYKNRLWFVEKNSMNAHYVTTVDAIGGVTDIFPLAGVFGRGGALVFGEAWSMEGSLQGGLSEQLVFVSSEGEVAVYQGSDPNEAATWSKVGLYRIGTPLGNQAHIQGGGDIAVATTVGLVPLSKAIALDITSLNVATISYKIADAWSDAIEDRGRLDWHCKLWPEQKMAVVAPPDLIGSTHPVLFVSNTETGAWARYTGWNVLCMEVFEGRLFFGSTDGKVFIANVGGLDDGETYSGAVAPLFEDMGTPGATKIGKVARAVVRANTIIDSVVSMLADYETELEAQPSASGIISDNLWGTGIWGQSTWGTLTPAVITQDWQSIGGAGYACSLAFQVTSGSIAPLDAELIRLEMTYEEATLIS